jgi:hypothetical protein
MATEFSPKSRLVVLRTEEGLYVGRNGAETILVEDRSRAVVWDWEADNVPDSLATVLRAQGRLWTPEPVERVSR